MTAMMLDVAGAKHGLTPGPASGFISDEFDGAVLGAHWTHVDPLNDATCIVNGAGQLEIAIPGGVSHDLWNTTTDAVRVMQPVANTDFELEMRFNIAPTLEFSGNGWLIQSSADNWFRIGVYSDGSEMKAFFGNTTGGSSSVEVNATAATTADGVRVTRVGDLFTMEVHRSDTDVWETIVAVTRAMNVTEAGVYAVTAGTDPAWTAQIEYARDNDTSGTGGPPPGPPATATATMDIWYGNTQTFGDNGVPPKWINIHGKITDSVDLSAASVEARLNGGVARGMTIGPGLRRVYNTGDFTADFLISDLNVGANTVSLRLIGSDAGEAMQLVTVNWQPTTPALPVTAQWAGAVNDDVEVVDGKWRTEGGMVRTDETGYDRAIALGDGSWTDYRAAVTARVHSLGPGSGTGQSGDPLFGFAMRWPDHLDSGDQPEDGFLPSGGFVYWRSDNAVDGLVGQLQVVSGVNLSDTDTNNAYPNLLFDTDYNFVGEVVTISASVAEYRAKYWLASDTEPAGWQIVKQVTGGTTAGRLLLLAHHYDVSFGPVTITAA